MEDEYKEDDNPNPNYQGIWGIFEYLKCNVLRPAVRGLLFGLGHYLTYKALGGYISSRVRQFN